MANAFGCLKARWCILIKHFIWDAEFAAQVSIAACVLHNICERAACPFENEWLVNDAIYQSAFNGGKLSEHAEGDAKTEPIRSYLGNHVSRVHMAHDS